MPKIFWVLCAHEILLVDPVQFLEIKERSGRTNTFDVERFAKVLQSIDLFIIRHAVAHQGQEVQERLRDVAAIFEEKDGARIFPFREFFPIST